MSHTVDLEFSRFIYHGGQPRHKPLKEVLFDLHVFKRGVFGVLKYYLIQPQYGTTVKTFIQYSVIKENDSNFNGN